MHGQIDQNSLTIWKYTISELFVPVFLLSDFNLYTYTNCSDINLLVISMKWARVRIENDK